MSATSFNGGRHFTSDSARGVGLAMWALEGFKAHTGMYHASKSKKDFEAYMRRVLPQGAFLVDSRWNEENETLGFELECVFKDVRIWADLGIRPDGREIKITHWEGDFDPNATK